MENPCKNVKIEKLCSLGIGGTRLNITGTEEEIRWVSKVIGAAMAAGPRRSARVPTEDIS